MLKIQPNSRQVPKVQQYTADKKYNDLLYGVLQEMSYVEVINRVSNRYVDKRSINFQRIAEKIGVTRQTASSKFKNLLMMGLITECELPNNQKRYRLEALDASVASLVPVETLRKLTNTLSQHCISIYVYLMNRYIACGEQSYIVTLNQMKTFIGVATTTCSNNIVISDILEILGRLGLVVWRYDQSKVDTTNIRVLQVRNALPPL